MKYQVWALKRAFYDYATSFQCLIHVFILLSKRNKRLFGLVIPVVFVYRHFFISWATKHVQSAVLAELGLPALRLVRTAMRSPHSFKADVNGCKPVCSTIYPIRNGYVWIRKFAFSYWVTAKWLQPSKSYIRRGLSHRSRTIIRVLYSFSKAAVTLL